MNPHIGSNFDDFLKEEGILEETTVVASNRVLAWQRAQKAQALTQPKPAEIQKTEKS